VAGCSNFRSESDSLPTKAPTVASPLPTPSPSATPVPFLEPRWGDQIFFDREPEIELIVDTERPIQTQSPAIVAAEVLGSGIEEIHFVAVEQIDDDLRIVSFEPATNSVQHAPATSERWRLGLNEVQHVWPGDGWFLSNGESSQVVTLNSSSRAGGDGDNLIVDCDVITSEGNPLELSVFFDPVTGMFVEARETLSGVKFEFDGAFQFQAHELILSGQEVLDSRPGSPIEIGDPQELRLEKRALEPGVYSVGFIVTAAGEEPALETVSVNLESSILFDGYRTFVEPVEGYSFLYPESWPYPKVEGSTVVKGGTENDLFLTVTTYPDLGDKTAEDLKRETLDTFGNVQVLFEDIVRVDDVGGLWTAYGYESPTGQRTGVFLTVLRERRGYIIDLDGRTEEEDSILEIMSTISSQWRYRPDGLRAKLGNWRRVTVDGLSISVPVSSNVVRLDNGWTRFTGSSPGAFFAIRETSVPGDTEGQLIEHWLDVASEGVGDFQRSRLYETNFAGMVWERADFSYMNSSEREIDGFIMTAEFSGRSVITWVEAPGDIIGELESSEFLISLASVSPDR